jgi:hypothetical protein
MADVLFAEIDALKERIEELEAEREIDKDVLLKQDQTIQLRNAELQTAHEIGARHAKRVGEQAIELQALREAAQAHLHAIEHGSVEDEQDTADALAALLGGER